MTKHTPGPWFLEGRFITNAERGTAVPVATIGYGHSRTEVEANARLIAAAPELLAVAVRIVGAAISPPKDQKRKLQEVAELARAAIAKARGE